jgi:hypothetical protein
VESESIVKNTSKKRLVQTSEAAHCSSESLFLGFIICKAMGQDRFENGILPESTQKRVYQESGETDRRQEL